MARMEFPPYFLWGAATASYQVEGGIENNDWAEAARQGKVPICGRACDHYHRFEEDFDIAQSLGHTAHRFSIEWARIEPEEGMFDEEAIEHYRAVVRALRKRGMEPHVTLWHWTIPNWLARTGGIERSDFPNIFARYASRVALSLGDLVTHFSTLNEPYSTIINGWIRGTFPPFHRFPPIKYFTIPNDKHLSRHACPDWRGVITFFTLANTLARAHTHAYAAIKKALPSADVGVVFQVHVFKGSSFFTRIIARLQMWNMTHRFLARVASHVDHLGLNYYFFTELGDTRTHRKTDMQWDIRPEGVYDALHELSRYGKPIYVEECGCADAHDAFRAEYITETVRAIHRAHRDGIDVRGFMYWSLLDNYEWAHGFEPRFGLVEIDYDTLERRIRPSAYVYKTICEENAIDDSSV